MSDFDTAIAVDDLVAIAAVMQDDLARAERLGRPAVSAHCLRYHRDRLLEVIDRMKEDVAQ
ncbi:hypothetical protein [Halomonas alimentaria]|uniref:hypothetical protein n=1 Tax=Halomonas alimentaria TaxID=147248 RepID=UPI0024938160|nr:hypothetical protein [Halomonas alimentaria]